MRSSGRGPWTRGVGAPSSGIRRRTRGLTIIEVVFAIAILSGVTLALATFGQQFSRASGKARWVVVASDLATARLEMVRSAPDAASILALRGTETSATTTALPSMVDAPGFTRVTSVTEVSTASERRLRVTVSVSSSRLATPVRKSITVLPP